MATFKLTPQKQNKAGFTLIEVLIALAIFAIAITAILKATSQNTRNNLYLKNKTFALWVATDVINQTRVGLLKLPEAPEALEKETELLNQSYSWKASLKSTPNTSIKEIDVTVFAKNSSVNLIHLTSYLYVKSS